MNFHADFGGAFPFKNVSETDFQPWLKTLSYTRHSASDFFPHGADVDFAIVAK